MQTNKKLHFNRLRNAAETANHETYSSSFKEFLKDFLCIENAKKKKCKFIIKEKEIIISYSYCKL